MWTTAHLKCPQGTDWLAVVRVTPGGETTLCSYLGDIPEDVERELGAIQQRWTERATWPGDAQIQRDARIREYAKYPEEGVLADLVAELRREIDRGRLGSGWIASNVPAFYRAEELVR